MDNSTSVSVLIPCHNAGRWIRHAVESALSQTAAPVEVIVVDDGSTDDSPAVLASFGEAIRVESQPRAGGGRARNRLLELARGEWIQYLDADDYLLPQKLERQLAWIAGSPATDVLCSPTLLEEWREGRALDPVEIRISEPLDTARLLALWELPQTGGPLFHRQALLDVGGWNEAQPCCQEHELYLRLLLNGARFGFLLEPLAVYRHWSEGTVCRRDKDEVRRRRLEVMQRLEEGLAASDGLGAARRAALFEARLAIARATWPRDPREATRIEADARRAHGAPVPRLGRFPRSYQLAYRALGFQAAERVAALRRRLRAV